MGGPPTRLERRSSRRLVLALTLAGVSVMGCGSAPRDAGADGEPPAAVEPESLEPESLELEPPEPELASAESESSDEPEPEAALGSRERSPHYLKVGRWNGRVIERHEEFVRYRFEAPGEASAIVELSPRRPGHSERFGTKEVAVQPAPGADVDPELLEAITGWLRGDKPGSPGSFGVQGNRHGRPVETDSMVLSAQLRELGQGLLGLWLLAALFAAGLAWRARSRATSERATGERATTSGPWQMVGVAVLIAAAAMELRLDLAAPTPLDDDALRDIGAGIGCTLGVCPRGAAASFGGLAHGTGFPRLIGLCFDLGLDISGVQAALTVLFGLAVGLCFDAGRRLGGPRLGVYVGALAAVVELGLLLTELSLTGEILWNPAAVALPAALTQVALLRGAATGRPGPFLIAGLAAGLAFEAHVSGLALWPALLIVTAATARGRREAGVASELGHGLLWLPTIAGALAVPLILSPLSVITDGRVILDRLGVFGIVAAVLACLAVAHGLRRWLRRTRPESEPESEPVPCWRASALALALPMLILLGALLSASFVEAWPIRYFAPVFPALALSGAWLLGLGLLRVETPKLRALATALVAGLIVLASLPAYVARMAVDRDRWNYADVEAIAAILRERDVARDDVHLAVRGAPCGQSSYGDRGQRLNELLIGGLRMLGELELDPRPEGSPVPVWFVAKLRNEELSELPAGATTLASGPGHTLLMAPYEPVLDLARAQLCARLGEGESGGAESEATCVPATPQPPNVFTRHVLPHHELPYSRDASQALTTLYYELPLTVAPHERKATLWVASQADTNPWRFVDAQDSNTNALPANHIELSLGPETEATLTLVRELDESDLTDWWPPLIELPDDPALRALFPTPPDAG